MSLGHSPRRIHGSAAALALDHSDGVQRHAIFDAARAYGLPEVERDAIPPRVTRSDPDDVPFVVGLPFPTGPALRIEWRRQLRASSSKLSAVYRSISLARSDIESY